MPIFAPFSFFEQKVVEGPYQPTDADAIAFLNAAGITDPTISEAIDNLVIDLKADSIWTKLIALYPFVGGTDTTHKYNLVDPRDLDAAFRLTFTGTLTHDSNGITGDGSTGYYNTHIKPATNLPQDDNGGFVYVRNNVQTATDLGQLRAYGWQITARFTDNNFYVRNGRFSPAIANANTNSIGLFTNTRRNSTQVHTAIESVVTTNSNTSAGRDNDDIYGLCLNQSGTATSFSSRNHALTGFSDTSLSDTDISNLASINQTFQTTLGRWVAR